MIMNQVNEAQNSAIPSTEAADELKAAAPRKQFHAPLHATLDAAIAKATGKVAT